MNTLLHKYLVVCLILMISSIVAEGQQDQLDQFQGALKKREIFGQFREKIKQTPSTNGIFESTPSERTCGTMLVDSLFRSKHKEIGSLDDFEDWLQERMAEYERELDQSGSRSNVVVLPVIVHVVHNGEPIGQGSNISVAQVMSQIDVLNEDYRRRGRGFNNHPNGADIEIEFKMALVDPDGKPLSTPGINRINGGRSFWETSIVESTLKPNTIWDPNRYLNMWVLNFGGEDSNLLGYAKFPTQSNLPGTNLPAAFFGQPNNDGVVMGYRFFGRVGNLSAPYDGGRTTTHEVGHWLGLRHIWGDGDCSKDDFCADTPNAGRPNTSCVASNTCNTPTGDMIENYMDYSSDACMNIFTQCQKMRMRTVLQNSPRRKELLTSTVHIGTVNVAAPVVTMTADRDRICSGESVNFVGSSPNNPTSWRYEFLDEQGTVLAIFNGKDQRITFNNQGIYSVRLTATNSAGSDTKVFSNIVSVLSSVKYTQLIENAENLNVAFNDWLLFNPDADRTFRFANVSSFGQGDRSVVFDNYSQDDDPTGTIDALISPALDFSSNLNPYLYFEHAYAQYDEFYSDTLILFYSIDCGENFIPFWYKGGRELATAPQTTSNFVPNSNQWDWTQVSLGGLAGQSNVHIAIANLSGWGNNLYLDEISFVDASNFTNQAPTANFRAATTKVCQGDIVQFEDRSLQFPRQWQWQFTGGLPAQSSFQHPFVQYPNVGNFRVAQTVSNAFGTVTESRNNFIQVVAPPNIQISASQLPVCGGQPVVLTASGAPRFEWYDQRSGNLIHEGPAIQATLFENWTFTVVATSADGCTSVETFLVTISGPPMPSITVQGNTLISTFAARYQWYRDGQPIPAAQGGTAQNIQPGQSGIYIVQTFDASGCSNISNPVQYNASTSIRELVDFSSKVRAYPNPADQELLVQLNEIPKGTYTLEVINMLGISVQRLVIQNFEQDEATRISLSNLPSGMYSVRVHNDVAHGSVKIFKQ